MGRKSSRCPCRNKGLKAEMAFQRNKGTYAGKGQCSTCPKVDLSRWREALDAISTSALSAEWMPIFVTLSFIQSILSVTSLYQVLLSALDPSETAFSKMRAHDLVQGGQPTAPGQ